MFLSINALGSSELSTAIPLKKAYNTILFEGECYLDDFQLKKVELSDTEIEGITTARTWDINTLLLAKFEDNVEAGNLVNSGLPITKWVIRRKGDNESLSTLLAEVDYSLTNTTYVDYTPSNNVEYTYTLYAKSGDTEGLGLEVLSMADFFGWILTDNNGTSYNFDMEVDSENIQTVQDMKVYDGYNEKSTVRFGNRNYKTGSLKTIPYTINGNDITIDYNLLTEIETFINNKQAKTLKHSSGMTLNVVTHDFSVKYFDKIQSQPYTINFKWMEV